MIANTHFQTALLAALPLPDLNDSPDILGLLDGGFTVGSGFILLTAFADSLPQNPSHVFFDETGVEASINHFHLDDYLLTWSEAETLQISLSIVRELGGRLHKEFPECAFKIIIALESSNVGTVRLHRVRMGQVWTADNLDGYDNAVAVFTVPSAST